MAGNHVNEDDPDITSSTFHDWLLSKQKKVDIVNENTNEVDNERDILKEEDNTQLAVSIVPTSARFTCTAMPPQCYERRWVE